MKFVRDIDDAKGIVHDVFVSLWEKFDSLPADANHRSYLYTAVRNRCLNHLRDKKKIVALDSVPDHAVSSEMDPMGTEELEREIEYAINSMPPKCREVFELSRTERDRGEGRHRGEVRLKYAEIAERMGISVKTVEAHMSKALVILREHLGKFLVVIFCLFYFLYR